MRPRRSLERNGEILGGRVDGVALMRLQREPSRRSDVEDKRVVHSRVGTRERLEHGDSTKGNVNLRILRAGAAWAGDV
jgi:hypothetical protein